MKEVFDHFYALLRSVFVEEGAITFRAYQVTHDFVLIFAGKVSVLLVVGKEKIRANFRNSPAFLRTTEVLLPFSAVAESLSVAV